MTEKPEIITVETTILDILHRHRGTEAVFRRLEAETGTCVLCQGLFLSLREAAERFGFPAADVLAEIRAAIRDSAVQTGTEQASAEDASRPDGSGGLPASRRRASQR